MEDIILSWLILAAFSPLAAVLLTWALFVFHTYRREWRTLDLFLVGILVTDLIACILLFSYGLLQLLAMNSQIPQVCALFIWGLTAIRTAQVTILASMVVDRTLTVRWPYKYRFSVRRNQVRYHLTVLAVIGIFVGVAAVFARPLSLDVTPATCSALHFNLDSKFSIFIICLQGASLLTHVICAIDMQCYFCHSRQRLTSSTPEIRVSSPYLVADGRHLSSPEKNHNTSKRSYHSTDKVNSDIRWNTVTAIVGMCYVINHLPYLITIVMITFFLNLPSPWLDNGAAWLAVAEAFFLPFVLCMTDHTHLSAIIKIFHGPDSKSLYLDPEEVKFRYAEELMENKVGSRNVFATHSFSDINPFQSSNDNSTDIPGGQPLSQYNIGKKEWAEFLSFRGTFYGTLVDPLDKTLSLKPTYCDSLVKTNSVCSDLQKPSENDHIYASLSEKSEFSSSLSDTGSSLESIAADDDFEFHNTKDEAKRLQFTILPNEKLDLEHYSHFDAYHDSAQNTMSSQATTVSAHSDILLRKKSWEKMFQNLENIRSSRGVNSATYRVHPSIASKKLNYLKHSKSNKTPRKFISHSTSLSMNDLDYIHNLINDKNTDEFMYILPVRSDSRLSLYQIPIEKKVNDTNRLTKAVSDGNLHFQLDQDAEKDLCVKPFIKDSFEKHSRFSARGMTVKKILKQVQRKEQERIYLQKLASAIENSQPSQEQENGYKHMTNQWNKLNFSFLNDNDTKEDEDANHKNRISSNNLLHVLDRTKCSYFDNGKLCWHDDIDENQNQADIKKVFVSDYL